MLIKNLNQKNLNLIRNTSTGLHPQNGKLQKHLLEKKMEKKYVILMIITYICLAILQNLVKQFLTIS